MSEIINVAVVVVNEQIVLDKINSVCLPDASSQVNKPLIVKKIMEQTYNEITDDEVNTLIIEQCISMSTIHLDYGTLASRLLVKTHHDKSPTTFSESIEQQYNNINPFTHLHKPLISAAVYKLVNENKDALNAMIDDSRDYLIDYFGFKTLSKSYLVKNHNKQFVDRPQYLWMRVAIEIHREDLAAVKETYDLISQKYFIHATPTLFNAARDFNQLSSFCLLSMEEDSIENIYDILKDCALISKFSGGIGVHMHNIRAKGTCINNTNGFSTGIVPMLKVFNSSCKYVDQCVVPETIIYTTNGPMEIQYCSSGETQIYNLKGEVETIGNVLEHPYDGPLLNIKTIHSLQNLRITPEHPVYVKRHDNTFDWVDAKDLQLSDSLVYSIPTYSKDIDSITPDDCYMYGILQMCCNMNNNKRKNNVINLKPQQSHLFEFIRNYFDGKCVLFTIEDNFDEEGGRDLKISWEKTLALPFRHGDFYLSHKHNNDCISSKWTNLPIDKSKYILKGLLNTAANYTDTDNTHCNFRCESLNIIETVRFMCLKLGVLPTITRNKSSIYTLKIPFTKPICDLLDIDRNEDEIIPTPIVDGFLYSKIIQLKEESNEYSGTLYDLQMTNEHNYMLHNGIVHNGGGKRNGSFVMYLEPWHADVFDFLDLKRNHGDEELKARDLFYGLWIPDLFMERVRDGGKWALMCPYKCPGLADVYGDEFKELYERYEREGKANRVVNAKDLWLKIVEAQMETGTPYLLYKDACNKKSNQKNLGTIKSSNLCTEIIEYSDVNETAVCNLASIALPSFVNKQTKEFDYDMLHHVTKIVSNNLNKLIDNNKYPIESTRNSNLKHRPTGVGVQGLADVFFLMGVPFTSATAKDISVKISETMYHASLEQSNEIAIARKKMFGSDFDRAVFNHESWTIDSDTGATTCGHFINHELTHLTRELCGAYSSFIGSPLSRGEFQFDLWGVTPSDRYDWAALRQSIVKHGVRNSLSIALMPTATTSQILGFNECFEPITSNIYSRRTLAGDFIVCNKYLMKELIDLGLWSENIKDSIIQNKGSIQHLTHLPEEIRNKYKIVWELPMKEIINMSADRAPYICQSQSLNLWQETPTNSSLSSMHFYAWKKGLKTGIYYLRRKSTQQAQQFTIDPKFNLQTQQPLVECTEEVCTTCSA